MLQALQFVAALCAALFAGASLYINVAEHPARMELKTGDALAQWGPSYRRATWMQAPLALLAFLTGLGAWLGGGALLWLIAALFIGFVVPFTFIGIMPTNRRLLDPARDGTSAETRALLQKWARLHAVRTAASLIAMVLMLYALVSFTRS